ncbi:protein ANTAGONIST OF LIKE HETEROCHROMATIN PROTEIN 1-like [Gigantopelta aegis]|uniref:protein ANTAGONIST OF LIKE HETEROCHROMATIN PROTEIN 1-like n=1 Tax=Gigantopelta aegis TaxID=1735272 RepID=UPI001B888C53|nr:protein ANTAGONIST OF LIKE HETEROCHROMATIN PROTEIN 1-like [Gigantopelta aegis]
MNNVQFRKHFRIQRSVFEELLDKIKGDLTATFRGGFTPTEPEVKILVFLWYIAKEDAMKEIGVLFGIGTYTVHKCIREVSKMIAALSNEIIKWPSFEDQCEIAKSFKDKSGIDHIIGAIDGTHTQLLNLPNDSKDYFSRREYPSVQLQLVVDHNLRVMDAYTDWPGSAHDTCVFRNSKQNRFHGHFLLGDCAYPAC